MWALLRRASAVFFVGASGCGGSSRPLAEQPPSVASVPAEAPAPSTSAPGDAADAGQREQSDADLDAGPDGSAPGTVDAGAGTSSGISAVARVVARMRPGFRRCFARALERDPSFAGGALSIEIEVGIDGSVTRARVRSTKSVLPASFALCMEAAARAEKFEPPKAPMTLTVPVNMVQP